MSFAVKLLALLTAIFVFGGCRGSAPRAAAAKPPPSASALAASALLPSPRLIIGRVIACDPERHFAFVELAPDAPANAIAEGADLMARTLDLQETARLHSSRYVRARTLGTVVVSGQPSPGDEVVWLAP